MIRTTYHDEYQYHVYNHKSNKAGTIRECFAVSQLIPKHDMEYGKRSGSFNADGKISFEVGIEDKTFKQVADLPDSGILADNIGYPIGKKPPLWLIVLLY